MRALHHRCTIANPALAIAAATTTIARTVMRLRSSSGIASFRIVRNANGGTKSIAAAATIAPRKTLIVPRYGRAKCHTRASELRCSFLPFTAWASPGIIM